MSSESRSNLFSALNRAVRLFIAGSSLYSQRMAERFGLHPTDMQFLNLLELLGPATPGVLGRCSGLSSGGVTVVLDRLEKAGYARRSRNPADRRSVLISVVPARQKKITAAYTTVQQQFLGVLGNLSDEELRAVLKFFSAANEARPPQTREPE